MNFKQSMLFNLLSDNYFQQNSNKYNSNNFCFAIKI